jgi:hypothetical protein
VSETSSTNIKPTAHETEAVRNKQVYRNASGGVRANTNANAPDRQVDAVVVNAMGSRDAHSRRCCALMVDIGIVQI